jgi:hypothetical protein
MTTEDIEVTQLVKVTVDESKFTPEWMADFREHFYPFTSIEDHMEHIAQLAARGVISTPCFIEGYGQSDDMGIRADIL